MEAWLGRRLGRELNGGEGEKAEGGGASTIFFSLSRVRIDFRFRRPFQHQALVFLFRSSLSNGLNGARRFVPPPGGSANRGGPSKQLPPGSWKIEVSSPRSYVPDRPEATRVAIELVQYQ